MYPRIALFLSTLIVILACGSGPSKRSKPRPKAPHPKAQPKATPNSDVDHEVAVDSDGRFSPSDLTIAKGDTVRWTFEDARDAVIAVPVGHGPQASCKQIAAYDASLPAGPTIDVPAGLFVLQQDGPGLVEQSAGVSCDARNSIRFGDKQVCASGRPGEIMQSTWDDPAVTGALIRLRWNEVQAGPGEYDWSVLDREMARAVAAGKQFSVAVKAGKLGTPEWIFDAGVDRVSLQDWGTHAIRGKRKKASCGFKMDLGSPADPTYRTLYFSMLEALGDHIKQNAAHYRALAMVKPSGMNLMSHENRIPTRCEEGCTCNTEVWANAKHPYTPDALVGFYDEQFALIERVFPGKRMSFMLIQAGFPQVADRQHYLKPDGDQSGLPRGAEQTEDVLALGRKKYRDLFIAQHNGLGPGPAKVGESSTCPARGEGRVVEGCPNPWALKHGKMGFVTGFQTNNLEKVKDGEGLDRTMVNLEDNSKGVFLEVYEEMVWWAAENGGALSASGTGRTLEEWNNRMHTRAKTPSTYTFTFDGDVSSVNVVSPFRCNQEPTLGQIKIR